MAEGTLVTSVLTNYSSNEAFKAKSKGTHRKDEFCSCWLPSRALDLCRHWLLHNRHISEALSSWGPLESVSAAEEEVNYPVLWISCGNSFKGTSLGPKGLKSPLSSLQDSQCREAPQLVGAKLR